MTSTEMGTRTPATGGGTDGASALEDFYHRAQHGFPASFPLVQFPNVPFLIALASLVVGALAEGTLHDVARATFYAAAAVWAWLELTSGVNWPHRVLGAAALLYVIVDVADTVGS